ncbi:plasmid pRiA4b ORF-3 family protein [Anaerobacillus alkaliphilus]|uniref:Plasmid pRiA4b ORF-3 family protein n=1 Tax=Anaerobacillus alkaliphilus TaxID=1548597 RepID=A0A4Q0VM26_9BACI|nr:plasmid pRiA4b ORF-3 family protein [Anaerobacillus alkaliphilus]RXI96461.1 plasmid pRiA4b ORF-3 family protein [Anaerobacillus alkaliphilus]
MIIHCTKKLLDELKIKPSIETEENPLFSWHANILIINRKKTVVFVNDLNRFVVVLYGLKAKELQKLDECFIRGIREVFQAEGIQEEVIEDYLQQVKQVSFAKTKGRTYVARLNRDCEDIQYLLDDINANKLIQTRLSKFKNSMLVGDGKGDYYDPNEEMYKALAELTGKDVFRLEAVELKITLQLENFNVWRTLVVPTRVTFDQFHKIIQTAFGWRDWHLHEFSITDKNETVARLVGEDEIRRNPNSHSILESEKKLSDFLPPYKTINYIYDFGDGWEHKIELINVIPDNSKNYVECIAGEGATPPEDVGGEYGFKEFLAIISDENHPEHFAMTRWGIEQEYKPFNLKEINRDLLILRKRQ